MKFKLLLLILAAFLCILTGCGKSKSCDHELTNVVKEEYLKSPASCTLGAVYYKSCSLCYEKSAETFTDGEALSHAWSESTASKYLKTDSTCTENAVYYKSCASCGAKSTETFTYGAKKAHTMIEKVEAKYLSMAENCLNDATYYKSCSVCGAADSETFTLQNTKTNHANKKQAVAKTSTCGAPGNSAYWYCPDCKTYFSDEACTVETDLASTVIAALGHKNKTHTDSKPASCSENGNIEYWYCSDCQEYFSDESCTAKIAVSDTVIDAIAHKNKTHTESTQESCTKDGNIEYWYCPDCREYFSDESCTEKITASDTVIPKTAHNYDLTKWDKDATGHWHACACGAKDEVIEHGSSGPATEEAAEICPTCEYVIQNELIHSHTPIRTEPKDASCTEDGTTGYWQCTGENCGKYFENEDCTSQINYADTVIAAIHHKNKTYTAANGVSCTENGNSAYWYCPDCQEYFSDEECTVKTTLAATVIDAIAHKNKTHTERIEASCTKAGNTEYWYCPDCQEYFSDEECTVKTTLAATVIDAIAHKNKTHTEQTEASCTKEGHTEHWYCPDCEAYYIDENCTIETTLEETVIPVLAHKSMQHVEAKEATKAAEGNIEYWYCPICDKYFSDENGTTEISKEETVLAKLPSNLTTPDWFN